MWLLIFTMWTLEPNGEYKSHETQAVYDTAEQCEAAGQALVEKAGHTDPANFFCFKKGEKLY